MERNNLQELLNVLESIRAEKYPEIPAEVIREIVQSQYENQSESDRVHGRTKTTKIIAQFLDAAIEKEKR